MKKNLLLLAVFAFLLAMPSATFASLPEVGGNPVNVTKCTQVGNDIQVVQSGNTYDLTTACRKTEYGYKFYTMKCTSDTGYYVSWKPCTSDEIAAVTKTSCTEGDNGINYFSSSWATGVIEGSTSMATVNDSCGNSIGDMGHEKGSWVAERNCSNGYVHTQWYKCENGCEDGACLKEPAETPAPLPKCSETDGLNYNVFGTATGNDEVTGINATYGDSCGAFIGDKNKVYGNYIAETHCSSFGTKNYVHTQWYKCENGCVNGVCQPKPVKPEDQDKNEIKPTPSTSTINTLPTCSDIKGGNTNFIVCAGFSVDHFWSGSRVKVISHNGETANVELGSLSETDADLVLNVPETFYITNKPGKYLTVTYLGIGDEGRALLKVDSNTTYEDSYSDSCTNEKGVDGVYAVCKNKTFSYDGVNFQYTVTKYDSKYVWLKMGGAKNSNVVLKLNAKKKYALKKAGAYVELTYLGKAVSGGAKVLVDVTQP